MPTLLTRPHRQSAYEPLGPRPSAWPLITAAVVAVLVVLLLIVVGVGLASGGKTVTAEPSTPSAAATASAAAPTESATSAASVMPATAGPLQLIRGATVTDGVPTGFPHSIQGAVSAAYNDSVAIGSTLSPDRAAVIGRVVADPSWTSAQTDLPAAVQAERTVLQLPASPQGTDGGATAVSTPSAFQTTSATDDDVDVLLLSNASLYNPTEPALNRSALTVASVPVHWDGTDWKMTQPDSISAPDRSRLTVDPASAAATSLGWQALHA